MANSVTTDRNAAASSTSSKPTGDTLTVVDNRTGKQYDLPIKDGAIRAMDLKQIKTAPDDFGLVTYDPAFMNTASCRSTITFIDGDKGILEYRGYPIEQLAESSNYLETAYLIIFGELPTKTQLETWTDDIKAHWLLHENIKKLMEGFQYDAHPMGVLISTVGAFSTFYPDAKQIFDEGSRRKQVHRLIAKVPTIAAYAYRHSIGRPYVYPDDELSFTGNFLNMLFKRTELKYKVSPVLERALDILFILHADHEQNCSTSAMRGIGSSHVDPYSAMAGCGGGALRPAAWRRERSRVAHASGDRLHQQHPGVHQEGEGGRRSVDGLRSPCLQVVRPARQDHQENRRPGVRRDGQEPAARHRTRARTHRARRRLLHHRKLYPNVDFYSGLIYQAMGFPVTMFPVLFAIPRTSGWIAQWEEMLLDPDQKITRPRQLYVGQKRRDYAPLNKRG
jgi:citrate synthase